MCIVHILLSQIGKINNKSISKNKRRKKSSIKQKLQLVFSEIKLSSQIRVLFVTFCHVASACAIIFENILLCNINVTTYFLFILIITSGSNTIFISFPCTKQKEVARSIIHKISILHAFWCLHYNKPMNFEVIINIK